MANGRMLCVWPRPARPAQELLRSAKQTTAIATINVTQLRAFSIQLPPLALQRVLISEDCQL